MKKIVSALLVSAAISAPAFAVGFSDGVVGTKYAAVDLGSITYGGLGSATSISIGGGYQVHPAVAIEANYLIGGKLSYGSIGGVSADYSLSALQVQAVGNYTINNEFAVYGKAGLAFNSQKATIPVVTGVTFAGFTYGTQSATTSSTDLTWSIGAKYKVNRDIALRVQYQETGISAVNVLSVGATFNF